MGIDIAGPDEKTRRFLAAAADAGIKITRQRLEVFKEVTASRAHPDAETVFRAVRARLPSISLDTVYRTLATLCELKIIGSLGAHHGGARFDGNMERHHHYICTKCGKVEDFTDPRFDRLDLPAHVRGLGTIESAQVEIKGLCSDCLRKTTVQHNRKSDHIK